MARKTQVRFEIVKEILRSVGGKVFTLSSESHGIFRDERKAEDRMWSMFDKKDDVDEEEIFYTDDDAIIFSDDSDKVLDTWQEWTVRLRKF